MQPALNLIALCSNLLKFKLHGSNKENCIYTEKGNEKTKSMTYGGIPPQGAVDVDRSALKRKRVQA